MKEKIAADIIGGVQRGNRIYRKIPKEEQPSIMAASSNSKGRPRKNWINI